MPDETDVVTDAPEPNLFTIFARMPVATADIVPPAGIIPRPPAKPCRGRVDESPTVLVPLPTRDDRDAVLEPDSPALVLTRLAEQFLEASRRLSRVAALCHGKEVRVRLAADGVVVAGDDGVLGRLVRIGVAIDPTTDRRW